MTLISIYSNNIVIMKLYTASVQGIAQRSGNDILAVDEIPPSRDFCFYLYIYLFIYLFI